MTKYRLYEIETMLSEFQKGTSLEKLAEKLDRTPYGIALKMTELSKEYPETFNPERVRAYARPELRKHRGNEKEQKRRYKLRKSDCKELDEREGINWKRFFKYLKSFISSYNRKKQDFAYATGIHPSLLSKYPSRERAPSAIFLRRFSELAGISHQDFLEFLRQK